MRNLFVFLYIFCCFSAMCQEELRYENHTYLPHIKSVKFHISGLETSEPIIDLSSRGSLTLSFDDILGGSINYTYRLIHCDKDWQPSNFSEIEYLDGFNDEVIQNYFFSVGTKYDYTNYSLTLPNQDLRWTKSGNYLLVVTDDETGEVALTRRFLVTERKISIDLAIDRSRKPNRLLLDQALDLKVYNAKYPIVNPQKELYVTILQNGRWDNALQNIQPKFTLGDEINFDQTSRPALPGYNEFRNIDLRSVNTRGFGVYSIDIYEDEIDVLLETDYRRGNQRAIITEDLNGDFVIDNLDYNEANIRSEYVNTFFSLASKQRIRNGDVYVIGAFNNWKPSESSRLSYDLEKQLYHGSLLLKQGYYDYQYVVQYDNGESDIQYFEGSHFSTANQYHILVYHRSFGERYDRLIGTTSIIKEF